MWGGGRGNSGVNNVNGPVLWSLDRSLFKSVQVSERVSLQFRAELFNGLNHPNLGTPNAQLGFALKLMLRLLLVRWRPLGSNGWEDVPRR